MNVKQSLDLPVLVDLSNPFGAFQRMNLEAHFVEANLISSSNILSK